MSQDVQSLKKKLGAEGGIESVINMKLPKIT